uniref:Uncharacterized protein LOC111100623 isoform X3 n=1 Tax=Crassostrea virginica TaxID=6565 RepID=A0A8B8AAA8_CRAVI|nr:uncharacterized protein LOC111100623 isoform X3 [Crassostrea virginica]
MTDYIYTILLIQLCNQIRFVVSFTRRCNESLQTVQKVSLCPTNLSAYEAAAKQKNCSSFNADSCHSFQYHCVLSEDFHSLVEVCAPSLNIIGHVCAKFMSTLKSILRVEGMNCTEGPEECPYSYNSTHAYKYQQCYSNVLFSTSPTTVLYQSSPRTATGEQNTTDNKHSRSKGKGCKIKDEEMKRHSDCDSEQSSTECRESGRECFRDEGFRELEC